MLFGDLGTNIKMVNKYYTANGLPIEEDKTWKYGNGYTMAQEKDPAYTNVIPLGVVVASPKRASLLRVNCRTWTLLEIREFICGELLGGYSSGRIVWTEER